MLWVTVLHNCNGAWQLNRWSQRWLVFFLSHLICLLQFQTIIIEALVTVLLEGMHIFMFVVYGLYLYTCWFTSTCLGLFCVFLWHTLVLTTFFFLYKSYFSHRDMHSYRAGLFIIHVKKNHGYMATEAWVYVSIYGLMDKWTEPYLWKRLWFTEFQLSLF